MVAVGAGTELGARRAPFRRRAGRRRGEEAGGGHGAGEERRRGWASLAVQGNGAARLGDARREEDEEGVRSGGEAGEV